MKSDHKVTLEHFCENTKEQLGGMFWHRPKRSDISSLIHARAVTALIRALQLSDRREEAEILGKLCLTLVRTHWAPAVTSAYDQVWMRTLSADECMIHLHRLALGPINHQKLVLFFSYKHFFTNYFSASNHWNDWCLHKLIITIIIILIIIIIMTEPVFSPRFFLHSVTDGVLVPCRHVHKSLRSKSKSSLKSLRSSLSQVLSIWCGVQVTSQVFVLFISNSSFS